MKAIIVSSKELFDKEKNPTLCLNTLRALKLCHKCSLFQDKFSHSIEDRLKCKPQLKPEIKKLLLKRRRTIRKQNADLEKIRKQIKKLEG